MSVTMRVWNGIVRVSGIGGPEKADEIHERVSDLAQYHSGWRCWNIPMTAESVAALEKMTGSPLPPEIGAWLRDQERLSRARVDANALKDLDPEAIRVRLEAVGVRFRHPMLRHQIVAAAYALKLPACGLFLDTGTGKTATLSVVMQALADLKGYRRFLVMAPKSILGASWAADVAKFSWLRAVNISDPPERDAVTTCPMCGRQFRVHVSWQHLRTHLPAGAGEREREQLWERNPELRPPGADSKSERLARALDSDAHVFLINPESFKIAYDEITKREWDMFVVDESSCLKNPRSQTTKSVIAFGSQVKRRIAATATPRVNSSMDFWGQLAFLDQGLGGNFYSFRDRYFYKLGNGFTWKPKTRSVEKEISDIVFERAIRFRLDDCVGLPGETFETRRVELTPKLAVAYQQMRKEMRVVLDSGKEIATEWLVVKLNKLSQITSGFIFDENGNETWLDTDSPKIVETMRTTRDIVENEERSVVIWIRFQAEAETLGRELARYGVSTMHGGTRDHEASAAAFKSGKNKVMIAHPASAKFGHTWVEHCNLAIFHSYDYSFENWYQARRRIYRIGQKRPVTYLTMAAEGTIDVDIIGAVAQKNEAHEVLVEKNVAYELARLVATGKS